MVQEVGLNVTLPTIQISNLPSAIEKLGHDLSRAGTFLLIPTELLYFSIYFYIKRAYRMYKYLTFLSLAFFWLSPWVAPIHW